VRHDRDGRIAGVKEKGELKTARIPIKIVPQAPQRKPDWIRVKAGNDAGRFGEIKKMLREQKLHTVCEEAACPNIGECFGRGTATFMILGDICTRRCPFCDVGHGKPLPPDVNEPAHLADSVARLKLRYVVITSVDRDDLRDGGAQHFVDVIAAVRRCSPGTIIETLVPDFRGRMDDRPRSCWGSRCRTFSTTIWRRCRGSTGRHGPAPTTRIRWLS
jgi:lipoic acid synthetase